MTDHFDFDRLARYVSGESGATERAEIERWAAAQPANQAMLDSVRRRWSAASDGSNWNVDAAWARLSPRLRDVVVEPGVVPLAPRLERKRRWFSLTTLVPVAAAAVLVVAVALNSRTGETPGNDAIVTLANAAMATGIGEQRTFDLSDGSQVVLGAASTLRLADGFGTTNREVHLEGQAFLRVQHDASKPFVVNAAGTRAIDLGTAFEVRAYPNEGVRVAVTEGVVEVRRESAADSAVLQPGDIAEVAQSGDVVILRQQDVERLLGWTRGELVFDDTPLRDVGRELERWYDVRVRIQESSLEGLRMSMRPRIGESLDEILKLIEMSLSSHGIRVERNGNVVTIRSGPPATRSAIPSPAGSRVEAGA
jgi:ferric-dicitrate binding protein FerR (iron transport regulator)